MGACRPNKSVARRTYAGAVGRRHGAAILQVIEHPSTLAPASHLCVVLHYSLMQVYWLILLVAVESVMQATPSLKLRLASLRVLLSQQPQPRAIDSLMHVFLS